MDPRRVSARFAALIWFARRQSSMPSGLQSARQFINQNWIAFLPSADPGLGQLLIRLFRRATLAALGEEPRHLQEGTSALVRGVMRDR